MDALRESLAAVQERRETFAAFTFERTLAARLTDTAVEEALLLGLPMAQGIVRRIVRSRGQEMRLTVRVIYREGVRMLEAMRESTTSLNAREQQALRMAQGIAAEALLRQDEAERFQYVFDWIVRHIRYAHIAPGRQGYERLVGASGALLDRQANCQGFADVLYLLCGLCGIACEYRIGHGKRLLHVWNAVCIGHTWKETDASRESRRIRMDADK